MSRFIDANPVMSLAQEGAAHTAAHRVIKPVEVNDKRGLGFFRGSKCELFFPARSDEELLLMLTAARQVCVEAIVHYHSMTEHVR